VSHSNIKNVSDLQIEDVSDIESRRGPAGTATREKEEVQTINLRGGEKGADLGTVTSERTLNKFKNRQRRSA
jgi:hypothetical protein